MTNDKLVQVQQLIYGISTHPPVLPAGYTDPQVIEPQIWDWAKTVFSAADIATFKSSEDPLLDLDIALLKKTQDITSNMPPDLDALVKAYDQHLDQLKKANPPHPTVVQHLRENLLKILPAAEAVLEIQSPTDIITNTYALLEKIAPDSALEITSNLTSAFTSLDPNLQQINSSITSLLPSSNQLTTTTSVLTTIKVVNPKTDITQLVSSNLQDLLHPPIETLINQNLGAPPGLNLTPYVTAAYTTVQSMPTGVKAIDTVKTFKQLNFSQLMRQLPNLVHTQNLTHLTFLQSLKATTNFDPLFNLLQQNFGSLPSASPDLISQFRNLSPQNLNVQPPKLNFLQSLLSKSQIATSKSGFGFSGLLGGAVGLLLGGTSGLGVALFGGAIGFLGGSAVGNVFRYPGSRSTTHSSSSTFSKFNKFVSIALPAALVSILAPFFTIMAIVILATPVVIAFFLFIINSGAYVTAPGFSFGGIGGAYPKCWPAKGNISQGPPGTTSCGSDTCSHIGNNLNGVDIANFSSPKVYATHDGLATAVYNDPAGYGNLITITSTDGKFKTLYGHFASFSIPANVSVPVKAGQILGIMGTTGFSTGIHVHYELRVLSGSAININKIVPKYIIPVTGAESTTGCFAQDSGGSSTSW